MFTVYCMCVFFSCFVMIFFFFFFKQKTAYEMRISDWSSDVCSSDLGLGRLEEGCVRHQRRGREVGRKHASRALAGRIGAELRRLREIGRASCRERVCQYV